MNTMRHLCHEFLEISMFLLFHKNVPDNRIHFSLVDFVEHDNDFKFGLVKKISKEIKTYSLESVFGEPTKKYSLYVEFIKGQEQERKLLEFLKKYTENFKNNKLEVGIRSFLTFEENLEWAYKILHDASIGGKDKIVINNDYLGLKELYPNLPEGIRLLEVLLFLHFKQLINITDCDYLQEYGARLKIELINSPEKIKSDLEVEKNPALKGYSYSVIKTPEHRHVITHSNGNFCYISKPRIWDIFNDLIQINNTTDNKVESIAEEYKIKNRNGNFETPLKTYIGEINTMLKEIHCNKNKKHQYVKIKNGLFEINIP